MDEQEGVIKFALAFTAGAAIGGEIFQELNAWRRIFHQMDLIGQDSGRYGGLGFGNISRRYMDDRNPDAFLITGSQTAHLDRLSAEHYVLVHECDITTNRVIAEGPIKPSSEALTHGAVYQGDRDINAVVHVHSPEIWNNVARLQVPFTDTQAPYGTPEMARQIQNLLDARGSTPGVIVMKGHADGVVSYGPDLNAASAVLISLYQRALALCA